MHPRTHPVSALTSTRLWRRTSPISARTPVARLTGRDDAQLVAGGRECLSISLDSSTQSLTAIVIDIEKSVRRRVRGSRRSRSTDFAAHGTGMVCCRPDRSAGATSSPVGGSTRRDDGEAGRGGLDLSRIAAVSGSAQQHGSVYLNSTWGRRVHEPTPVVHSSIRSEMMSSRAIDHRRSGWIRAPWTGAWRSRLASVETECCGTLVPAPSAIHRPTDPPILQTVARALWRDGSHSSGQLVSRLDPFGY
jgi:hypothetical protein